MPNRHYPPAYLRYLKARLLNLAKPSFWGTAIVLSVIGLVIREYWYNPDMFTYNQNPEVTSSESDDSDLSAEDKAIAADIDNLPILFKDLEQGNLPITANLPPTTSLANNNDNLLREVNQQQSSNSAASSLGIGTFNNTSTPRMKNPFVAEAENLLQSGGSNVGNQFSGINPLAASSQPTETAATSSLSGIGVNQTENIQNINSIPNFSQTAFNQSNNQTFSGLNDETTNQINPVGQNSFGGVIQPIQPNNGLPSTGLNAATGIQPTVAVPNNLPPNSFNNVNSIQGLPSPVQPTTLISPVTSGIQTGVQTNMSPDSIQPPIPPNNVTQMSPVVADKNGNLIWRSPSEQMQSNSSDTPQTPAPNTGRIHNNNNLRNLGF